MTRATTSISFEEIVKGRDATVRVTDDGLLYAVDLVTTMTGKDVNQANECLRDLNQSLLLLAVGCWLLAVVGCGLWAVGCWLVLAVGLHGPSTSSYDFFETKNSANSLGA